MENKLKKSMIRMSARIMGVMTMCSAAMLTAFADANSSRNPNPKVKFNEVTNPVGGLIDQILWALIPVVASIGAVFCIGLGMKYSRAEEPQEREKAKHHLKSAIIGFMLIFILIVAIKIGYGLLRDWMFEAADIEKPKA